MKAAQLRRQVEYLEGMRTLLVAMSEPLEEKADHTVDVANPNGLLNKRERELYTRLFNAYGEVGHALHTARKMLLAEERACVRGVA